MDEKNKKKPPTEVDDICNCNNIIADYLKFVKPPTKGAAEVLKGIDDKELLGAVLEYIASRAENKDKMTARAIKQFVNKLNGICELQGISESDRVSVQIEMVNKAICAGWKAPYPLTQSELKFIREHNKNNESSFSMADILAKVNNFD